ncbi:NACHT, LRR and PYD domains-containing protein 13 [Coemansia interrupta]|uniref:NACHT, LRR and PYD domains-containing protein 13 n=1 Tax=Coemansia interrupta TaxID=1126814 RepID=A0A9W8LPL6_9FUNG|nr:NACHT, LRR and PYD domains-containing protein 13 [Coemansia interrupta]
MNASMLTGAESTHIPIAALPKSGSATSLASLLGGEQGVSTSPTLCEPATCSTDDLVSSIHSREIAFVDVEPVDLIIADVLGERDPRTIECLRINGCRMDGSSFSAIVEELCTLDLPNLHTVDVSKNQLGGPAAGSALARLLAHAPSIRFLSLGWNYLSLFDLKDIGLNTPCSVTSLDLRSNPLYVPRKSSRRSSGKASRRSSSTSQSDAEHADIFASTEWVYALIDAMPNLTHVQLAQANIGDKALVALLGALTRASTCVEYIGLEWLDLGSRLAALCRILDNTASSHLQDATDRSALHLNLAANNLGDAGIDVLTSSRARLSSLTLACNFITERGTSMLAKWLPSSEIVSLDLSDNYFGDQGMISLLAIYSANKSGMHYTQIRSLALNSCCLSDVSLRVLADALACNWAPLESVRILRNGRMTPGAKISL